MAKTREMKEELVKTCVYMGESVQRGENLAVDVFMKPSGRGSWFCLVGIYLNCHQTLG